MASVRPLRGVIAAYFPLERGRLKLTLPLNLGACGLFAVTCHEINARTSLKATNMVYIRNQSSSSTATGTHKNERRSD